MCNMTPCQVQKLDGESPQVIWVWCVLYTSWTECCWLPDSGGGGQSKWIWWYLTPAWIGWRPLPQPAFTLNPLLRFRLTTHTSHEAELGTESNLIYMSLFVCPWFDTRMDGLWLMNAQKSSPFRTIHKKWHFNSTPFLQPLLRFVAVICSV